MSNYKSAVNPFPRAERTDFLAGFEINLDYSDHHRTLDTSWNFRDDTFSMHSNILTRPFTIRGLYAIFDPIGFVSPVVLGG